jgi:hypothetical protein
VLQDHVHKFVINIVQDQIDHVGSKCCYIHLGHDRLDRVAATPTEKLLVNSNIMHLKIEAGELGTIVQTTQI